MAKEIYLPARTVQRQGGKHPRTVAQQAGGDSTTAAAHPIFVYPPGGCGCAGQTDEKRGPLYQNVLNKQVTPPMLFNTLVIAVL